MRKLKFKIRGMDCQACAMLIEGELREIPGVEEVKVDYASNEAAVVYDELIVKKEGIFRLVEELGNYHHDKENEDKMKKEGGERRNDEIFWPEPRKF